MSSYFKPNMQTYVAGGTIVAFTAVKYSGDNKTVVTCGAGEDGIGIAQSAASSGQPVEVAMPGGGAKWTVGGSLGLGLKACKSDASGFAVLATDASRVIGLVDSNSNVLNDIAGAFVQPHYTGAAQS